MKILVINGTSREGNNSSKVSAYIAELISRRDDIDVKVVSPEQFDLPLDGGGKDPKYTESVEHADGFVIVIPEYNHFMPGSLKRLLDSESDHYQKKPVLLAGVSAGLFGGARALTSSLSAIRRLGFILMRDDLYFPSVGEMFDENGKSKDDSADERVNGALDELVWYINALRK